MSEWFVEVVTVGKIEKHPNADALSITQVHGGYPVIFRTGEFQEGDLAIYVPVDSIVPETPHFAFLQSPRIKAKKLRGIFSQGLLLPTSLLSEGTQMTPGMIVHEALGIHKWEPKEELAWSGGEQEKGPEGWDFVKYTDIEGLRRYKHVLDEGECVVITEKIHGSNGRFCWDGERLWVGSRNQIKKEDAGTFWWQVAANLDLAERLKAFPKTIFFGEVYGKGVQDLSYGMDGKSFIVFDTFDVETMRYNDWPETVRLAGEAELPLVPTLYLGPWQGFDAHMHLAEGKTVTPNEKPSTAHVREGFVVKPIVERWHPRLGRVILKLVGTDYLLRKEA